MEKSYDVQKIPCIHYSVNVVVRSLDTPQSMAILIGTERYDSGIRNTPFSWLI